MNDAWVPNLSSHRQNPTLVALGEAIRRVRKDRGLSQEQLALTAEVDLSYLGRVERGDNAAALLTLKRIADALGVTMATLMGEAGL
jgi:transcriptional regulator with XRE-family HTH domain